MTSVFSREEKDAIIFHAVFGIVALIAVVTASPEVDSQLGTRLWALLIGYHVAIIWVALRRQHRHWLLIIKFLVPLSMFMVFPDGFLVIVLKTLAFPDSGVGQIFQVTSFMAFMWTIPIFLSTLVGLGFQKRGAGTFRAALYAGISGLLILLGTRIPIWYQHENSCTKIAHTVVYVLLLEFSIGTAAFLTCRYCLSQPDHEQLPYPVQIFGGSVIMTMYLGNLVFSYMIMDADKLYVYPVHKDPANVTVYATW